MMLAMVESLFSIYFTLSYFHLFFSGYSDVDTIVVLPVNTANAVFKERAATYNLIGETLLSFKPPRQPEPQLK